MLVPLQRGVSAFLGKLFSQKNTIGVQLAVVLSSTLLAILATSNSTNEFLALDAGQSDTGWALNNFHSIECHANGCYRWSEPTAQIFFYELDGEKASLHLRMSPPVDIEEQTTQVSIASDNHAPMRFTLGPKWRNYYFLAPIQPTKDTLLTLTSTPFRPSNDDTRELGAGISRINVHPLGTLTLWRLAFLVGLPVAGCLILWASGAPSILRWCLGFALVGIAVWAAANPVSSGYLLPMLGWSEGWFALGLLVIAPMIIRWRYQHIPGGAFTGLVLLLIGLLALRISAAVALGLIVLAIGTVLLMTEIHLRRVLRRAQMQETPILARESIVYSLPHKTASQLPALTGIRFFAALGVVLFHYQRVITFPPWLDPFIAQGQASVGMFFVLSGFILVYTYAYWFENNVSRFWSYAQARFARVFPVYALALLLATPLVLYFFHTDPVNNQNVFLYELSWLANLFMVHVYIPLDVFQTLWNSPSWSLAAEAMFYVVFPFFVYFILRRVKRIRSLIALIAILFVIEIMLFATSISVLRWVTSDQSSFEHALLRIVHKSPFLRVWEFLIGAALGAIFLQLRAQYGETLAGIWLGKPHWRNLLLLVSLAGLGIVVLWPQPANIDNIVWSALHWYVLYTPFYTLLILALACGTTWISGVLSHPWIVRLGEASYALYILHYIPRSLITVLLPNTRPSVLTWVSLGVVSATILASLAVYHYFERPMRQWLRGESPSERTVVAGAQQS